ncbi:phosphate acetyltransferase [Salinibacterium sp. SYSU T00001]|uniref:phosphate acetyltransferase n=1 Tax=Homoserinimonas sedimenticola TaxID=2986805 RepID=UPI002235E2C4|nr:phosphate acetyltransferase [Salinibacterium sedimenticola]MCW4385185.1 phosphate acetyltransferase [Salinibacterium sedimenticola]
MARNIYITSVEGHAGKSTIALGLLDTLAHETSRVGVFRPVARSSDERDYVLEMLLGHDGVDLDYEQCVGVTYDDVHADPDAALSSIVERFKSVEALCDAVVILGSDYTDVGSPTELSYNARIAANLGAPVLLVLGGQSSETGARSGEELSQVFGLASQELEAAHAHLLGVVANRAHPELMDEIRTELSRATGDAPVWVLPEDPFLIAPTMQQLLEAVDGTQIKGDPALLQREALGVVMAGMSMENCLTRLIEGAVVVVAGDRSDVLLAMLMANRSETFPSLAGIILNGGFDLLPQIERLIDGLEASIPIIRTEFGTYDTAQRVTRTRGRMAADSRRKFDTAIALFEEHVDASELLARLQVSRSDTVTPLMFEYDLLARARQADRHIVLPEGGDDRILHAASILLRRNVARLTILGDEGEVRARAAGLGLDIAAARILSPFDPELRERFAEEYTRLRAHKGMTLEVARETVTDVSYFGTMMVHLGLADGMVSGAAHTTAHTIRPSFEIIKTKPDTSVVSSIFLMCLEDRVLAYGDCAVIPDPDAGQLADIAISSAETASQFGIDPRVAMLSYSTGESGSGADVEKVREATALVRERRSELPVAGPIQYDAAVDAAVGRSKMPDSDVAGRATVFVFPDLNTGNNTYKAVQRSAGAVAIGPVLQGLNKPINDLSRGALVQDIVNTVAITAIQAASPVEPVETPPVEPGPPPIEPGPPPAEPVESKDRP